MLSLESQFSILTPMRVVYLTNKTNFNDLYENLKIILPVAVPTETRTGAIIWATADVLLDSCLSRMYWRIVIQNIVVKSVWKWNKIL